MTDVTDMDARRAAAIEATRPLAESLAQPDPIPEAYVVTKPGTYDDMPEAIYHRDPVLTGSLSSTGAKRLLPPSCPAIFDYQRRHPVHKDVFDFGRAAHRELLGVGAPLVVVEADSWRTKAAQAAKDDAYSEGMTPLLRADYDRVQAMIRALREHPLAAALFNPDRGRPEVSAFWVDKPTNVWRRARFDWLPEPVGGRLILPDFKTAVSAHPGTFARKAPDFGYEVQAAFYLDAVEALDLGPDPAFLFVAQMKEPPFVVSVIELDVKALDRGRRRVQQALEIYRECTKTGRWPGFSDDVTLVALPAWAEMED